MKKESKWFIDGLLIGSVCVGLVLAGILFSVFSRQASRTGTWLTRNLRQIDLPIPQPQTEISEQTAQKTIYLRFQPYVLIEELADPEGIYLYRLLAQQSEENRSQFQPIPEDADNEPACLDALGGFENSVLTIWDEGGQRLLAEKREPKIYLGDSVACPLVRQWYQGKLVIEDSYGEAGFAHQTIYLMQPDGQTKKILGYEQIYTSRESGSEGEYHLVWRGSQNALVQTIDAQESASPLYRVSSTFAPGTGALEGQPIAFETAAAVKANLLSQANFRDYERGLHVSISGQEIFLLWNPENT